MTMRVVLRAACAAPAVCAHRSLGSIALGVAFAATGVRLVTGE